MSRVKAVPCSGFDTIFAMVKVKAPIVSSKTLEGMCQPGEIKHSLYCTTKSMVRSITIKAFQSGSIGFLLLFFIPPWSCYKKKTFQQSEWSFSAQDKMYISFSGTESDHCSPWGWVVELGLWQKALLLPWKWEKLPLTYPDVALRLDRFMSNFPDSPEGSFINVTATW